MHFVRPEIERKEYEGWLSTAHSLGYSKSGKGLWRLVRRMFAVAREMPSLFRKS